MAKLGAPQLAIISRADAKARGLTHYFTGKPCPKGHTAKRYVATWTCSTCSVGHVTTYQRTNPQARIASNLRNRLRRALNHGEWSAATAALVGCSLAEFRVHLESLFQLGMTWGNHGEWVIAHAKPLKDFDLTDPDQLREVMHYRNIQPRWGRRVISQDM